MLQVYAQSKMMIRQEMNIHWKDWYRSWNSNTLATWCKELTHWKRPWCWERLKAGGEGDDRAWDGWMASLTQWTWVWASSRSWWWTGKPGTLQSMGPQRVDMTEWLNWTEGRKTLIHLCSQECPFPFIMLEYWKHMLASGLSLPSLVVHFKCTLVVQEQNGAEAAQQCPEHLLCYPLLVTSAQSQ